MLPLLEREVQNAFDTHKRRARADGEKITVKLLLPLRSFAEDEEAVGVVEVILILVVLIGLVLIFKDHLTKLVKQILTKIASQSNSV